MVLAAMRQVGASGKYIPESEVREMLFKAVDEGCELRAYVDGAIDEAEFYEIADRLLAAHRGKRG